MPPAGPSLADLGYGGNALSSTIEEWNFTDNMTYSYRLEKQTSIMSPYGSMVRPSSTSESGMWAPPDQTGPQINILLLRDGTDDREAMIHGRLGRRPTDGMPDQRHSLRAFLEL